jgi:hypothetical protein
MKLARKIFVATLLTGVVTVANLGAVQAGDYSPVWKLMRPLYAISFDVGRKHVLSYFLSKSGSCDLTVMVTDRPPKAPEGDDIAPLQTERFKAAITSNTFARFDTTEGRTLEYACESGARAMRVRELRRVVATSPSAQ